MASGFSLGIGAVTPAVTYSVAMEGEQLSVRVPTVWVPVIEGD